MGSGRPMIRLNVWERRILRKICGPLEWEQIIRNNQEVHKLYEG